MKNKIKIIFGLLLVSILSNCQKEHSALSNGHKNSFEIKAVVVDNNATKVGFNKKGKFFWSEDDRIGVMLEENLNPDKGSKFTAMDISSGVGTGLGTFKGEGSGNITNYAIYPYDENHLLKGDLLTYSLSYSDHLNKVENDFFEREQGRGSNFQAPMYGKLEDGKIQFKHLGGVLCIKLGGLADGMIEVVLKSDQKLRGNFTVDLSDVEPKLITENPIGTEADESDCTTKLSFWNEEHSSCIFLFPLPTGTFKNLSIIATNVNKEFFKKEYKSLTINRRDLKVVSNIKNALTIEEANQFLEKGYNLIDITGDITGASTGKKIVIPNNSNSTKINFVGKAENINITEKSGQETTQKVALSMNGKQGGVLDINLPHSTVTLEASVPATFTRVISKTAGNTLKIENNITIQELNIEGGNVVVQSGAAIERITLDNNQSSHNIYPAPGSSIPESLPDGVSVITPETCIQLTQKTPTVQSIMAKVELEFAPIVLSAICEGEYGICYSTENTLPDVTNSITKNEFYKDSHEGKGEDDFNNLIIKKIDLLNLKPTTTYYYRAYLKYTQYDETTETETEATYYSTETKSFTTSELIISKDEYVDLGLSVYWRNRNLGAENIEDLGNKYYWSATEPSKPGDYLPNNIKERFDKNTRTLLPEYDVATIDLGSEYHIPTREEMEELRNCSYTDYVYKGKEGLVICGPNGKTIFLPKTYYEKEQFPTETPNYPNPNEAGWYIGYWSSQAAQGMYSSNIAYCLIDYQIFKYYYWVDGFKEAYVHTDYNTLFPIRPVKNK